MPTTQKDFPRAHRVVVGRALDADGETIGVHVGLADPAAAAVEARLGARGPRAPEAEAGR